MKVIILETTKVKQERMIFKTLLYLLHAYNAELKCFKPYKNYDDFTAALEYQKKIVTISTLSKQQNVIDEIAKINKYENVLVFPHSNKQKPLTVHSPHTLHIFKRSEPDKEITQNMANMDNARKLLKAISNEAEPAADTADNEGIPLSETWQIDGSLFKEA